MILTKYLFKNLNLFYNHSMKKLLLLLLIVLFFPVGVVFADDSFPFEARVIYNSASVYSTKDIFSLSQTELESVTLKTFSLHDVVEINGEENEFYTMDIEGQVGYILKTLVINNNEKSPVKVLETNAEIAIDCDLYKTTDDLTPIRRLEKGVKVRILDGFDNKKEFTQISFQENGTIYTFYVKTSVLKVKGVNYTAIVAVTTILAGISIALIIIKIVRPKPIIKDKK